MVCARKEARERLECLKLYGVIPIGRCCAGIVIGQHTMEYEDRERAPVEDAPKEMGHAGRIQNTLGDGLNFLPAPPILHRATPNSLIRSRWHADAVLKSHSRQA